MDIDLNGVTYSYSMYGKGPVLVLLHGFTGCKENWSFLVECLSSSYTIITIDLIGHGQSEAPANYDRYEMEHVCDDLVSLLNQLDIDNVHLLGYSMGGRIALAFSLFYPTKVKSLILESSSPGLKLATTRKERIVADNLLADAILQDGIEAFINRWENIPLFHSQKKLTQQVQNNVRAQRLNNKSIGLANSLRGLGTGKQPSYWDKLSKIERPVLLLCGELDLKFCAIAEEMEKKIKNSTKYLFFNVGHAIHVEHPELFGKIVGEFLSREMK